MSRLAELNGDVVYILTGIRSKKTPAASEGQGLTVAQCEVLEECNQIIERMLAAQSRALAEPEAAAELAERIRQIKKVQLQSA